MINGLNKNQVSFGIRTYNLPVHPQTMMNAVKTLEAGGVWTVEIKPARVQNAARDIIVKCFRRIVSDTFKLN